MLVCLVIETLVVDALRRGGGGGGGGDFLKAVTDSDKTETVTNRISEP